MCCEYSRVLNYRRIQRTYPEFLRRNSKSILKRSANLFCINVK